MHLGVIDDVVVHTALVSDTRCTDVDIVLGVLSVKLVVGSC